LKAFTRHGALTYTISLIAFFFLMFIQFTLITRYTLSYVLSENYANIALRLNKDNSSAFFNKSYSILSKFMTNNKESQPSYNRASKVNENKKENISGDNKNDINLEISKFLNENKTILNLDPLNSKLYWLAGRVYAYANNTSKAQDVMQHASKLSVHEIGAHEFMFLTSLNKNLYVDSVDYADRLITAAPEIIRKSTPHLSFLMHNDDSRPVLIKRLTENPVWRSWFFSAVIPKSINYSVDYTRKFYDELNNSPTPASIKEKGYFINALIASGKYDLAYKTWLDFFSPKNLTDIKLINNGSFESFPSGLPFDWSISSAANVRAQILPVPGESAKNALRIEINRARVNFPKIYEYLNLPAGRYNIVGSYKGELMGKRGLSWIVSCLPGKKYSQSDQIIGRYREWRTFKFEIDIPESNCDAQIISLVHGAISPSEQLLYGTIWFDDLMATSLDADNKVTSGN